jgi:hypothetical protein
MELLGSIEETKWGVKNLKPNEGIRKRGSEMAWDGFDPDTREALMVARTDSRNSFYSTSSIKKLLRIVVIAMSLCLIGIGLFIAKPLGYGFVLGGVLGLEIAATLLSYRS